MRGWWQDLADLVVPGECAGCGTPRTALCVRCRGALYGGVPRRVRPEPEPLGLPEVHAAAPYADAVRAVLLAHKERGALGLARPLGAALAGAVRAAMERDGGAGTEGAGGARGDGGGGGGGGTPPEPPPPCLLIPIPSAAPATRARGHDPTRRIALAAAGELRRVGVATRVVAVLRQRRRVVDQAGLNSRERLANLEGALEVAAGGGRLLDRGARVVLVDDLMTTGASLTEAARALRAGGTENGISGAVVAASPDSFGINRN